MPSLFAGTGDHMGQRSTGKSRLWLASGTSKTGSGPTTGVKRRPRLGTSVTAHPPGCPRHIAILGTARWRAEVDGHEDHQ
jgi:hypothetical protein